jgi:hypothetical protein
MSRRLKPPQDAVISDNVATCELGGYMLVGIWIRISGSPKMVNVAEGLLWERSSLAKTELVVERLVGEHLRSSTGGTGFNGF